MAESYTERYWREKREREALKGQKEQKASTQARKGGRRRKDGVKDGTNSGSKGQATQKAACNPGAEGDNS